MSFLQATIYYLTVIQITNAQKYIVEQHSLTPSNGDKLCAFNYDTNLASLHSSNDWSDARTIIGTYDVFIGLTDSTTEGTWVWFDGTTFDYGNPPASYTPPWRSGQPDNWDNSGANPDGEDCVHMNEYTNDGEWNDIFCTADIDRYALCNYPQITPLFNDPSHIIRIPTPNTLIGVIDILDNIHIEFDIKFTSWPSPTVWGSILHIGDGVTGGQRFPAIYIYGGMYLHTSTALIPSWNTDRVQLDGNVLNLGQIYHFSYIQTQETLVVYVDSNSMYDGVIDSHAILKDRNIYLSNTFNTDADQLYNAEISNLYIATSNAHSPNSFNYNCDATNRWETIVGDWTINDTTCTVQMTNAGLDRSTAWMGGYDTTSLDWDTYKIEVDFQIDGGNHAGIFVRAQTISNQNDQGQQYFFGISKGLYWIDEVFAGKFNNGFTYGIGTYVGITYGPTGRGTMRIEANSNTFDVYWNNEYLFTYTDNNYGGTGPYYTGSIGLTGWQAAATYHSVRITFPSDNYLYTVSPTSSTSAPTTTQPTTVNPTTNNPTTNQPTTAIPTTNMPTTIAPTTNNPTTNQPTTNQPTTSNPTTNNPTTINPTTNMPTTVEPTTYNPTTNNPTTTIPTTNQPTSSNPTTNMPTTNIPTAVPTTSIPTTSNPTPLIPTTAIPTTMAPTTSSPTTNQPTTNTPTTNAPTTTNPTTYNPTTTSPTTSNPTTNNPTTSIPTTTNPTTTNPTTNNPTTYNPTTSTPTTAVPTTLTPTTTAPTTVTPTTYSPTTNNPTTNIPTTNMPTTYNPTTTSPTTSNPTTFNPTTSVPTTYNPTTSIPTTIIPTEGNEGGVGTGTESIIITGNAGKKDNSLINNNVDLFTIILIVVVGSLLCSILCLSICLYKKRKRDKVIKKNNMILEMELQRVQSVGSVSGDMNIIPNTPYETDTMNMPTNTTQNTNDEPVVPNAEPDVYSDDNALQMWLTSIGLMEYFDIFIQQGFGEQMSTLSALTDHDLEKMGINKLAHRKRILLQIENNKNMINNQYNNGYNENNQYATGIPPVVPNYLHNMHIHNGTNGEGPLLNGDTGENIEMEAIDGNVTGGNNDNEYEYYYENDDEKNDKQENESENESDVDNMYEKGDKISPGGPGNTPGNQ